MVHVRGPYPVAAGRVRACRWWLESEGGGGILTWSYGVVWFPFPYMRRKYLLTCFLPSTCADYLTYTVTTSPGWRRGGNTYTYLPFHAADFIQCTLPAYRHCTTPHHTTIHYSIFADYTVIHIPTYQRLSGCLCWAAHASLSTEPAHGTA
ncbi:hypothetical protein F4823DRAFT_188287 [Ustulina deusta]|nr:hypothetical protein F4823DRAFT_188287 [Ustulina deusta]